VAIAAVNLVPSGRPGTSNSISDGRMVQLAWAARRGPVPDCTEPRAEPPTPSPTAPAPREQHSGFRWPFATALFLAAVLAFALGGASLLLPLTLVFGLAFLQGAHRDKLW
jgi:hypothetical protein